ncbi:MAG: hypothetical protein IKA99_01020 [Clostridia bacterium]|nr:hypothetical protein [Clostridia bacterium]
MYVEELIRSTNAYKIIAGEKKRNSLSHAYLIVCPDADFLKEYLKVFARLIACDDDGCNKCRVCKLIGEESYADCSFYPREGTKILTADVDDLLSQTYIKPLENKIRLFVLSNVENMNGAAQNKILKTLEEPPANVCILMGATMDYSLLPTVKSRVKRIDVPPFGDKILKNTLIGEFSDIKKLDKAIAGGGGRLSEIVRIYEDSGVEKTTALCRAVLTEMKSSKDVVKFSSKIDKDNLTQFVAEMKAEVMRVTKLKLAGLLNDTALNEYSVGALLAIEDILSSKERAINFSSNVQMTVDTILFGILEEKHKWLKL